MYKNIILIFIIVLAAAAQICFVWSLPYPFNLVFLPVQILIFLIIFGAKNYSWIFIIITGLILDIYDFTPLGFYVLFLGAIFVLGQYLFTNYFTNRSYMGTVFLGLSLIFAYALVGYFVKIIFSGDFVAFLNVQEIRVILALVFINFFSIVIIYPGLKAFAGLFKNKPRLYEKI